ncbi:MAG: hypothetical protein A4E53_01607 [Pelotomaculum sp. PtaB.Bin104]|nr:MAG: hypothetical protein A4E53_01607 [Pelotomaculum sp. PtaB.Bin104]
MSHCIINANAKVVGLCSYAATAIEIVSLLMVREIGIIQLPCPEMTVYGLKRWGHVREQFNYPYYREKCRQIVKPIIDQLIDYLNNGYKLTGIIGVDGSPSCGVHQTCSGAWGGELTADSGIVDKLSQVKLVNKQGIFMEEIIELLKMANLDIPLAAIDELDVKGSVKNIEQLI